MNMREIIEVVQVGRASDLPVFYHGTSSARLADISREGLTPQTGIGSYNRGNSSSIKGWTEKNVYLTMDRSEAANYARSEANHVSGRAVLLVVAVPDRNKIVPDDDYIIDSTVIAMAQRNGWEPDGQSWDISDAHEASDNYSGLVEAIRQSLVAPLERIAKAAYHDKAYARIVKSEVIKATKTPWQQTLTTHWHKGAVGYRGTIPADMLKVVSL